MVSKIDEKHWENTFRAFIFVMVSNKVTVSKIHIGFILVVCHGFF